MMISRGDEKHWTAVVTTIWAIWRCCNEATYGDKKPQVQHFTRFFAQLQRESNLMSQEGEVSMMELDMGIRGDQVAGQLDRVQCWVDGSWTQNWKGGIGVVICKREELILYVS